MNGWWARRVRSAIAALAILGLGATEAAATLRIGVDQLRFAWDEAAGPPPAYLVEIDRGDGLRPYGTVTAPQVVIPVQPGDDISIAVRSARANGGVLELGPISSRSEVVSIRAAPLFAVDGTWTLRCDKCGSVATRSLRDASLTTKATGMPATWYVAARATLAPGLPLLVWRNVITGEIQLWDSRDLRPIPGGTSSVSTNSRLVGTSDLDGNGLEELLLVDTLDPSNRVTVWALGPNGLELIATLPAFFNADLASTADFTGDGKSDLLWHSPLFGRLVLWTLHVDQLPSPGAAPLELDAAIDLASTLAYTPDDAWVADAADYDGDGSVDLLWRTSWGALSIWYLDDGRFLRAVAMPLVPDGSSTRVVGSIDVDGIPGAEIAVQNTLNGTLEMRFPLNGSRRTVLHAGAGWSVVDVGP